jgi:hypothetical protein
LSTSASDCTSRAQLAELLFQCREPRRTWRRRRRRGWRRRPGVGQLLLDPIAAIHRPNLVLAVEPQLTVQPFEAAEVGFDLLRQLTHVIQLELRGAAFVLRELRLDVRKLRLQELRGPRRLAGAHARVLFHVEAREQVGHLRNSVGVPAAVGDGEGDRGTAHALLVHALEIEIQVFAHLVDGGVHALASQLGIEADLRDQLAQPRAADELLPDALQSRLELTGDRVAHELF